MKKKINSSTLVLVVCVLMTGCEESSNLPSGLVGAATPEISMLKEIAQETDISRNSAFAQDSVVGSDTFNRLLGDPCKAVDGVVSELRRKDVPINGDLVAAILFYNLPPATYVEWIREATNLYIDGRFSEQALIRVLAPPMEFKPTPSLLVKRALEDSTVLKLRQKIEQSANGLKHELLNLVSMHLDGPGQAADQATLRAGRISIEHLNASCVDARRTRP